MLRISALAVGLSACVVSAQMFPVVLDGAQEVPAVATPATGSGWAELTGGPGSYVLTYAFTYSGLQGPIVNPPGAHIHNAAAGANGPVVHFLDGLASQVGNTSGSFSGDWRFDDASRPLTDALAGEIVAGRTYFNVHTSFSTPGEIRGQIIPEPATLAALMIPAALVLRRRR
jgi:hypothetical protein